VPRRGGRRPPPRDSRDSEGFGEIDTRSGETIAPLDPDPAAINIQDIAHGLSNVGRFAGQGEEFYSVARHSVHVSHEVRARGGSEAAQRWALLHDASEAYLSDVPGPVKQGLPGYKHAERRLDSAIRDALDIDPTPDEMELVKSADEAVEEYELATQFPEQNHEAPELKWGPNLATVDTISKGQFTERAQTLGLTKV
jgi:hypothetical protein